MNKALFLDRDGILIKMVYDQDNDNIDTVRNATQIDFVPGIFDLLKTMSNLGFLNIVISNQSSIGFNKIKEKEFQIIEDKISTRLKEEKVQIHKFYYCFHHPFANVLKFKKRCNCRKPKPGLFIQATKEFQIDLKTSWMIGDGVKDIIAGNKIGCKTILLANIHESEYLRVLEENLRGVKPDFMVKKLSEVKSIITNNFEKTSK